MEENKKITYGKEIAGYYGDVADYQHPDEIMVTITIREYRILVEQNAKSDFELAKVRNEFYEKEKKLNAEIERLRSKILNDSDDDSDDE